MSEALRQIISRTIDRIGGVYGSPPWDREITAAREQFDALRGKVHDDEELFLIHMAIFLEWYVLDRPLPNGVPPVVDLLRRDKVSKNEQEIYRALAFNHYSLFEVINAVAGGIRLLDLIRGGIWRVEQEHDPVGLDPGEIFEARLLPWRGRVYFGPVVSFHPPAARECIHKLVQHAEREEKPSAQLINDLAAMRLHHSRFRNIDINRIYVPSLKGKRSK